MPSDPAAALARTLGAPLPKDFAALTDERFAALDAMIRAAADRRARELTTGVEQSLQHVPGLVRPAVRKMFGL